MNPNRLRLGASVDESMQEREQDAFPHGGSSADWQAVENWDDPHLDGGHVPTATRESFGRATAQGILAILGVFAFIALVLVWRRGTTTRDEVAALTALVMTLVVILMVQILLTRRVYDAVFRRVPAALPMTAGEDNFVVGCPGCGTVFTVTEGDLQAGRMACHNCGRAGFIKDYSLNKAAIRDEVCHTCGNKYLEYKEHSECPVCHTFNAY